MDRNEARSSRVEHRTEVSCQCAIRSSGPKVMAGKVLVKNQWYVEYHRIQMGTDFLEKLDYYFPSKI